VVDLFPVEKEEKLTVVKRAVSSLDEPVTFVVRNNSEEEFSYFGLGRHGEYSLQVCVVRLYRDGEQIPLNRPLVELPGLFKEHIRVLQPGGTIPYQVRLADYGIDRKSDPLPPGRYELRIEGAFPNGNPNEHNCTPFNVIRSILLIDMH